MNLFVFKILLHFNTSSNILSHCISGVSRPVYFSCFSCQKSLALSRLLNYFGVAIYMIACITIYFQHCKTGCVCEVTCFYIRRQGLTLGQSYTCCPFIRLLAKAISGTILQHFFGKEQILHRE